MNQKPIFEVLCSVPNCVLKSLWVWDLIEQSDEMRFSFNMGGSIYETRRIQVLNQVDNVICVYNSRTQVVSIDQVSGWFWMGKVVRLKIGDYMFQSLILYMLHFEKDMQFCDVILNLGMEYYDQFAFQISA